jgi:hypothetical protein
LICTSNIAKIVSSPLRTISPQVVCVGDEGGGGGGGRPLGLIPSFTLPPQTFLKRENRKGPLDPT